MNTIIGKKLEQTQGFLEDGTRVPLTVVDVADNIVLAVKTKLKHGYTAIQIGYGKRKNATKSLLGRPLIIKEARVQNDDQLLSVGDIVNVENVFKPGDIVKVSGVSKGKGFAGVVKRHHFKGGPRTHGQSDRERAPGSIGQTTTPGRVYRGKKMAGRMGHENVSISNMQIVGLDIKDKIKKLLIKGLVPGSVNSIITIEKTGELPEKKVVALLKVEETKET
jgi:large subunit ribosomal protein L3